MTDPLDVIRRIAEALMLKHGLTDWKFEYTTARRCAGRCKYRTKTIQLQRYHAEQSPLADIVDTILHEIAHALTPKAEHGPAWVEACQRIGARPEVCYPGRIELPCKWKTVCPKCGVIGKRYRRPKNRYLCRRCDSPVSYERNLKND